ncbi:MAG: diadenylate cyclase CdaA [Pseudanabaenaceae cyanobacterium]
MAAPLPSVALGPSLGRLAVGLDLLLVGLLIYVLLSLSEDRRTLTLVRGFVVLLLANVVVQRVLQLQLLGFVLDKLAIGAAVSLAVILQPELRRVLEALGRGQWRGMFRPAERGRSPNRRDGIVDELVDAIKELSQNRTGALLAIETGAPIDEGNFSVPGVRLNAELSRELLQTIFQTTTLLHDGAVWLRQDRILAAGVILPLSNRTTARKIGTRHRAAMGLTEAVADCFCIVVSEETGSIAIARDGALDRPVSSARLREYLEENLGGARTPPLMGEGGRFAWLRGWLTKEKKTQ